MDWWITLLLIGLGILIITYLIHFYIIFVIKDSNKQMWHSSHVSHGEWKYEGYKLAEPHWNGDHLFFGRWFNKFKSLVSYLNPYKKYGP